MNWLSRETRTALSLLPQTQIICSRVQEHPRGSTAPQGTKRITRCCCVHPQNEGHKPHGITNTGAGHKWGEIYPRAALDFWSTQQPGITNTEPSRANVQGNSISCTCWNIPMVNSTLLFLELLIPLGLPKTLVTSKLYPLSTPHKRMTKTSNVQHYLNINLVKVKEIENSPFIKMKYPDIVNL